MYSVLRFCDIPNAESASGLCDAINTIIPELCTGADHYANRISCSVSHAEDWSVHLEEMCDVVTKLDPVIKMARDVGLPLQMDLAIYPEEVQERMLTCFLMTLPLMRLLADRDIEFVFSLYAMDESMFQ